MVCLVGLAPMCQHPRSALEFERVATRHSKQIVSLPFVTHDGARLIQSAKQASRLRLADSAGLDTLRERTAAVHNNVPDALSLTHLDVR